MIVGYCSDLHLDHGYHRLLNENQQLNKEVFVPADVLIIAGDTIEIRDVFRSPESSVFWKSEEFRYLISLIVREYSTVIYVFGNHEYYGSSIEKCHAWATQLESEYENFHILQNDIIQVGDVSFFGGTLWTNLSNPISENEARTRMNDYRKIVYQYRNLRPNDTTRFHYETLNRIERFLEDNVDSKSVVVTHHAPSRLSRDEKFRDSTLNDAYMSSLDDMIATKGPHIWIHGHLHCANDYTIGKTRVLSNPRGYQPYEPWLCQTFVIKTFTI